MLPSLRKVQVVAANSEGTMLTVTTNGRGHLEDKKTCEKHHLSNQLLS